MDMAQVLALYDQQERFGARYPEARREVVPPVVRHINAPGQRSFIIYSHFEPGDDVDAIITREVDYFGALNREFEWKVYAHDSPPDLVERLTRAGFEAEESETLMLCDLHDLPESLSAPLAADVRAIPHDGDLTLPLAHLLQIEERVWETDMSWLAARLERQLRHNPDFISVFIAYVDGQPASAGWVNYPEGSQFASLYGGSTLPRFRNRGLYTQLVAARAQEALRRGYRYLTIDASPMSREILLKQRFIPASMCFACVKSNAA